MHLLRKYHSEVIAQLHAAHLRANGIMSGVLASHLSNIDPNLRHLSPARVALYITSQRHEERANELLDDYVNPNLPDDWESDAIPDLTRLDPALIPNCPNCDATLDPTLPFGPCPRCAADLDIPSLIISTHGPEALLPCYPHLDPTDTLSDDEILSVDLDCARCARPLDDLPAITGSCPRCNLPFDRREIVAVLLNQDPDDHHP